MRTLNKEAEVNSRVYVQSDNFVSVYDVTNMGRIFSHSLVCSDVEAANKLMHDLTQQEV